MGQDHITTTLSNALAAGKIAHAYLLTGPRGVGKTSIARILAHEINGLPYSEEPHFDIIEIDAASNNGVEDVRDLRDKIMSAPSSAKYKVFIIDEVHMLSKAAFNALLKTLEEPPAHVVFILATTEAHKLPETIISRTQRYGFRPAVPEKVEELLRTIAAKEKITLDDDALALIAKHGDGSFRDSVSLLDQASSMSEHVTLDQVAQLLGHAPHEHIAALRDSIDAYDGTKSLAAVQAMLDQGYEPAMIAAQLSAVLREEITTQQNSHKTRRNLDLLRQLLDIAPAHNPRALLEITIIRAATSLQPDFTEPTSHNAAAAKDTAQAAAPAQEPTDSTKPSPKQKTQETTLQPAPKTRPPQAKSSPGETPVTPQPEPATTSTAATESSADDDAKQLWQAVLQNLKQKHNTLYSVARMARPRLSGDKLSLELSFAFHKKRLNEPQNLAILTQLVESERGKHTRITCLQAAAPAQPPDEKPDLATISNIFGSAELLES